MSNIVKKVATEDEIINLDKDNIIPQYHTLFKNYRIRSKQRQQLIKKLKIKTKALWFAAGIIADNNIIPNKTQETIYEMLKAIGLDEYNKLEEQQDD